MRKNSEGEIRVRCAEAERGFLAGVKEMVKMRAEMGVMPWGKHVFYPRMLHKARPQKVSDFLVDDERWHVSVREVDMEKWGSKHHLYRSASGKYYLGLLFKSTKARSVRRKISLGTKDEEEAKERRELFYEEWEGKHLTWAQCEGAKWNMKVRGCAVIGSKSALERKAREAQEKANREQAKAICKELALKRKAQVKLEGFKKKTEEIKSRRVLMVGGVEKIGDSVVRRTKRKGEER